MVAVLKESLTDRGLKALAKRPAPAGKRYIVWDAVQRYLGVRVTDKGRCTRGDVPVSVEKCSAGVAGWGGYAALTAVSTVLSAACLAW